MNTLKGKRILITQSALVKYAGSEIVTLELADELCRLGATVKVFTWEHRDPIKKEFEKRNISVTVNEEDEFFDKVDLIWCHHQVIPERVIKKIYEDNDYRPVFIFNHMSGLESNYIEQPYIKGLENKLSSLSVFNSLETMEMNLRLFPESYKNTSLALFANPAPLEFVKNEKIPKRLKKVLVVSNHAEEELKGIKEEEKEFEIEYLGEIGEKQELLSIERLSCFDVVVTIGKTVQYCLVAGIPVYVYGRFGGCGYLNEKNFEENASTNFSGRGNKKKTPDQIVQEIQDGFVCALKYQCNNRKKFIENYSLDNVLKETIAGVEKRKYHFSSEEKQIILASMAASKWKLKGDYYVAELIEVVKTRDKQLGENEEKRKQLESQLERIKNNYFFRVAKKIYNLPKQIKAIRRRRAPKKEKRMIKINNGEYSTENVRKNTPREDIKIIGLIREKNESLILDDTLTELEKIVDGFVVLDDNSDDNSVEIAKKHPKCLKIIKHKTTILGDRSAEESVHRELLLRAAKKYNADWVLYQDADERFEDPETIRNYMLRNLNSDVSGIVFQLFDAYMTKGDSLPYKTGRLYGFRKMFGIERRDILMAWKNVDSATYRTRVDMREPDGIDRQKTVKKFYVQHYGKAISEQQWEDTCDYYIKHFPQYAEKWKKRKGRGIHSDKSDFGTKLMSWDAVKLNSKKLD